MTAQLMQFEFVAALVVLFALIFLYLAYRFLASSGWVMGWIQGNIGLALLLITGFLVVAIMDIRTYQPMFDDLPIATVSVHTLEPGHHQLRLVNNKGIEASHVIFGDEYQFEIHQFKWATNFAGMGMGHGYRVANLVAFSNGRKTNVEVNASEHLDVWNLFRDYLPQDFVLSATTVYTLRRKVVDGGMYELVPEAFDINVISLNQIAKDADKQGLMAEETVLDDSASEELMPDEAISSIAPISSETASETASEVVPGNVPAVEPAPTPESTSSLTSGTVIRTPLVKPADAKYPEEMPGANIEATPAAVTEKPASRQ